MLALSLYSSPVRRWKLCVRGRLRSMDDKAGSNRTASGGAPQRIDAHALLGPKGEVRIMHKGIEYRLRLTSNDKLILTK